MRDKIKDFLLYGKSLDLCNSNIDKIPSMITPSDIIHLNINYNLFSHLPGETELQFLESLKCYRNELENIPLYHNLKVLHCGANNITKISSYPNLEILKCQDNYIKHIPTMPKLKELRCDDNPLCSIAFQPNLEVIYLSKNNITELPILPKLRKIIIYNTHSFMHYRSIGDVCNLQTVVFEEKLKYLRYYIHVVKMQRRYRRNFRKKILIQYFYNDLVNNIISFC